nr:FkbM family methyltransferase [Actinomycetota bacterium]
HLLSARSIAVLADVGANEGQYALRLRALGYEGPIVSFEPSPEAVSVLRHRAAADGRWVVNEAAIGAGHGRKSLHVSGNSVSSSLLEMTDRHLAAEPAAAYVATIDVDLQPLDAFCERLAGPLWLKIDVQGAERAVLAGAERVLRHTEVIQAELSLVEVYHGAPTALELVSELSARGFDLVDIERGFADGGTGALLQADGLFLRREADVTPHPHQGDFQRGPAL